MESPQISFEESKRLVVVDRIILIVLEKKKQAKRCLSNQIVFVIIKKDKGAIIVSQIARLHHLRNSRIILAKTQRVCNMIQEVI